MREGRRRSSQVSLGLLHRRSHPKTLVRFNSILATYPSIARFLHRHATGDWRETPVEERDENLAALRDERGIFTQHTLKNGIRIWIATESDRSLTTVFLPSEDLPEQEESAAREALRARPVVSRREQCEHAARTTMIALLLGNPRGEDACGGCVEVVWRSCPSRTRRQVGVQPF